MAGATIPTDGTGLVNWVNNTDNWREEDAEFLQGRTVVRWANATARAASGGDALGPGSLSYLAGAKDLAINTGVSVTGWSHVLHSPQLLYTDTPGSNFQIKLSGGSSGLSVYSDGVYTDRLAVGNSNTSPKVKIDSSGITLNTDPGGTPGLLYTNNSGQVAVSAAAGLAVTGLSVSLAALFSSAVTFNAAVTFTSTVSINNLTVGSTLNVGSGGVNTPGGVVTGLAFATTSPNGYQLAGATGLTRSGNTGSSIAINSSTPQLSGSNVVLAIPSSGPSNQVLLSVSGVTAPVAAYMTGNSAPGTTNAPDGTIWFQI